MELFAHQKAAVEYFTKSAARTTGNSSGVFDLKDGVSWLLADGPRVLRFAQAKLGGNYGW